LGEKGEKCIPIPLKAKEAMIAVDDYAAMFVPLWVILFASDY